MDTSTLPSWVIICVGLANLIQIFSSAVMLVLGIVVLVALLQLKAEIAAVVADVRSMVREVDRHVPSMLNSADETMKNVKGISDDARSTTHNVTSAVDRVSHLVAAVSTKMESPAIKLVGVVSGLAAGLKVVGGRKGDKAEKAEPAAKRRGLLGFFK